MINMAAGKQISLLSFLKSSNTGVKNNAGDESKYIPSLPKKAKTTETINAVFQLKWLKAYFCLRYDETNKSCRKDSHARLFEELLVGCEYQ